jgi:2-polyprenyl-3-methyl-5-hydroxy-6-metoxy-1,4-benzoquinol methylase
MNVSAQQGNILAPVAAYDAFAPYYGSYSETRRPYLRKIENIVIAHARNIRSLLDVGAGDGSRALRMARLANVARVVLLEPSAGMRAQCPQDAEIWPSGTLEISNAPQFEVITCLWNVLGHIQGTEQRLLVLSKLKKLLVPGGAMFLDVTHRYNAASYGWTRTLLRALTDLFIRADEHRDVIVSWQAGGQTIRTYGHVFTHAEMKQLFRSAGLKIVARWVINYESGDECRLPTSGNLLYELATA